MGKILKLWQGKAYKEHIGALEINPMLPEKVAKFLELHRQVDAHKTAKSFWLSAHGRFIKLDKRHIKQEYANVK